MNFFGGACGFLGGGPHNVKTLAGLCFILRMLKALGQWVGICPQVDVIFGKNVLHLRDSPHRRRQRHAMLA